MPSPGLWGSSLETFSPSTANWKGSYSTKQCACFCWTTSVTFLSSFCASGVRVLEDLMSLSPLKRSSKDERSSFVIPKIRLIQLISLRSCCRSCKLLTLELTSIFCGLIVCSEIFHPSRSIIWMEWDAKETVLEINDHKWPVSGNHWEWRKSQLKQSHVLDDFADFSEVMQQSPWAWSFLPNDKHWRIPWAVCWLDVSLLQLFFDQALKNTQYLLFKGLLIHPDRIVCFPSQFQSGECCSDPQ